MRPCRPARCARAIDVYKRQLQACFFGDVGECAVAVVVKEAIPVLGRILFEGVDIRAVGEEDVGFAIAVVVEDSHASGHRLRSVPARCLVAV